MKRKHSLGSLLAEIGTVESLEQALILYKEFGMRAASKSRKTQAEYSKVIADLVAFLGGSGITRPAQVGLAHLRIYQADLEKRGYRASTRNRKTYAIKGFFRFLHEYALVQDDISKQLILPTV